MALLSYGSTKNDSKNGWIRVDGAADRKTSISFPTSVCSNSKPAVGKEYVGRVLQAAVWNNWPGTDSPDTVKLVFIAGNESAEQDQLTDLHSLATRRQRKDLVVHPVYCGRAQNPDAESWKMLAELAGGQFASIDHRSAALMTGDTVRP